MLEKAGRLKSGVLPELCPVFCPLFAMFLRKHPFVFTGTFNMDNFCFGNCPYFLATQITDRGDERCPLPEQTRTRERILVDYVSSVRLCRFCNAL